jgi:hypothetical protein
MIFGKYREFTPITNCYSVPNKYKGEHLLLDVLLIGLAEELLEYSLETEENKKELEAGDCMWYCSEIMNNLDMADFHSNYVYYKKFTHSYSNLSLSLVAVSKEFLSISKKYIRGDFDDEIKREKIKELVTITIFYFFARFEIGSILDRNVQKLIERKEKNTIKGHDRGE